MRRQFDSFEIWLVGILIGAVVFCAIGLMSSISYAETATANATVTVGKACTMTATLDSPHSVIVNPGQYVSEIGQTTFKAICNDAGGYAIYVVGNSNNEYGNNKLLASLGGMLNPTYDIATGTATSGSASNWAMKINAVSGAYAPAIQNDFGSYHEVPNAYTKVAQYNSNTDTSTGSSITSTYAAFVKSDQPAGSYNGKVKYTMVHPTAELPLQPQPSTAGYIKYFANASTAVGTMGRQSAADGNIVQLFASNFSRNGYGFAGWSDAFDYATNPNAHFYGPMEDIIVPVGTTSDGLSLYAVWVEPEGYLQDSAKVSQICGRLTKSGPSVNRTLDSISALIDQRDNEVYTIAKLADDKCWMVENMRLENTASHNADGLLAQGYGSSTTYGNFSGLAASESPWASGATYANSLYSTDGSNNTVSIGSANASYRFPRYNNQNTKSRASNTTNGNVNIYSYGNYYTWAAAIASTGQYATNDTRIRNTSICPSGWRLPEGGDKSNEANDDFWILVKEGLNNNINPANYNNDSYPYYSGNPEGVNISKALRSYPNNFLYSGSVDTAINVRGTNGSYWTSTVYNGIHAYALDLIWNSVRPGTDHYYKHLGRPIRCIASIGN